MADNNDSVEMQKMELNSTDFGESINSFGIEDTQLVKSKNLTDFLTSDITSTKNPNDIRRVETSPKEEGIKADESTKDPIDLKNEENQKKKDTLEDFLGVKDEEIAGVDQKDNKVPDNGQVDNKTIDTESDDTFNTLTKDLVRLGVFTKEDGDEDPEIKTGEEFLELFRQEQKKGAIDILDNFLSQFGEDYRRMFDAVFVKGVNPNDYLSTFNKISSVKDLDLNEENNQIRVLTEYYRSLKMDEGQISSKISKLKDYNDLADESKIYHKILMEREVENESKLVSEKENELKGKRAEEEQALKSYTNILNEKLKTKNFDGIPLTQKEAQDLIGYFNNKPYKLPSGELLSEYDKDILELNRPANHELKLKLGLLLKKKLDLSSVKKQAVSTESDRLFNVNTRQAPKDNKTTSQNKSFFQ